jgi:hypothetical protein
MPFCRARRQFVAELDREMPFCRARRQFVAELDRVLLG